jgi:VanZ family protein
MEKQDPGHALSRPRLHAARLALDVLFWPALVLVVWGELGPNDLEAGINDKVLHVTAYFGLAVLAAAGVRARVSAIKAVVALILFGGVLELLQGLVGRDMSLFDELANAAGALTGGLLARLIVEPIRRRIARE